MASRVPPGLILVEANAHEGELSVAGKTASRTSNGIKNAQRIRHAVQEANDHLNVHCGRGWALSCDTR